MDVALASWGTGIPQHLRSEKDSHDFRILPKKIHKMAIHVPHLRYLGRSPVCKSEARTHHRSLGCKEGLGGSREQQIERRRGRGETTKMLLHNPVSVKH